MEMTALKRRHPESHIRSTRLDQEMSLLEERMASDAEGEELTTIPTAAEACRLRFFENANNYSNDALSLP
jgi:hypothetical protein